MHLSLKPNQKRLIWATLIPIIIMTLYFVVIGVYPFGKQTILTVDLGQQYIDFFAYFRRAFFGHPGSFFYAFNKDLGGDMLGTYAYYLMSPFNLVTALFPADKLDVAIVVMTLMKYGAAGLTMQLYLAHHETPRDFRIGLSTAYALSGWMLANQLNIMWLDGVVFLPLIALGIDAILEGRRPFRYIGWLFLAIVSNYYIAYMICLFIVGYFLYRLVATRAPFWSSSLKFAASSLLAVGLSLWLLLPTLYQLSLSKGTYTETSITSRFEYHPLKLLGKLIVGSFSFDQMPEGEANIFVGSVAMFGVVLFFLAKTIPWREKIAAGLWSLFLFFSIIFEPLDLLWHGMQFPVWYPYRFSFVITFWLVILAARGLGSLKGSLGLRGLLVNGVLLLAVIGWVFTHQDDYTYLSPWLIGLSFLFGLGSLVFLAIRQPQRRGFIWLMTALMVIEAGSNAAITMSQLGFISHHDYASYTAALKEANSELQRALEPGDRVGKTVLRTKNDAMQVGFNGTDQFTSMMAPRVPRFFEHIGQSTNDGFVAYTNGTPILDSFLNLRGWMTPIAPNLSSARLPLLPQRPDLDAYQLVLKTKDFNLFVNPDAPGLGFLASPDILKFKMRPSQPIDNQQALLSALNGTGFQRYFSSVDIGKPTIKGGIEYDGTVDKLSKTQPATVSYTFSVKNGDPVYLELGSNFTDEVVSLTQDGEERPIYDTFRAPVLMNVTPRNPDRPSTLTFRLKETAVNFAGIFLVQLNLEKTRTDLQKLRQNQLKVTKLGDRSLTGTIEVPDDKHVLMTTLPNIPGWTVKIDGRTVKPQMAVELFMALPMTKGTHTLSMTYTPPYFFLGLLISLAALAITLLWWWFTPIGRHDGKRRVRRQKKPSLAQRMATADAKRDEN